MTNFSTSTVRNSMKLKAVQRAIAIEIPPIIAKEADDVLKRTIRNLDGTVYRKGKLPVRMITTNLKRSMTRRKLNNFTHVVYQDNNVASYGKFVHFGTRKLKPRRFLGDVIRDRKDAIQRIFYAKILNVIRKYGRA